MTCHVWVLVKKRILDVPVLILLRDASPGPATTRVTQELLQLVEAYPTGDVPSFDPVKDLQVTSMEFVEMKEEREQFEGVLQHYFCTHCPELPDHVSPQTGHGILYAKVHISMNMLQFKHGYGWYWVYSSISYGCMNVWIRLANIQNTLDVAS